MVKYLNKRNKEFVMFLVMFVENIDLIVESLKLSGEMARKLRTSKTYILNTYTQIIQSLERNQQEALLRASKHNRLAVVSDTAVSDTMLEQSRDYLYDIVEAAINGQCRECSEGNIVEGCVLRKAMIQYQIPVYQEECQDGECPFKQR